jgi:tryptophanyl-tRNA synthetase
MDEVRKAMRIDYFNDAELIRQQAERFAKKWNNWSYCYAL